MSLTDYPNHVSRFPFVPLLGQFVGKTVLAKANVFFQKKNKTSSLSLILILSIFKISLFKKGLNGQSSRWPPDSTQSTLLNTSNLRPNAPP